jgi:hypothetical protein
MLANTGRLAEDIEIGMEILQRVKPRKTAW